MTLANVPRKKGCNNISGKYYLPSRKNESENLIVTHGNSTTVSTWHKPGYNREILCKYEYTYVAVYKHHL